MPKKTERAHLAPGALTAPLPPTIVTVGDMERSNMLTVAWTGILATVPPKTYVSIRPSRHSHAMLTEGGEFVINLPSADMARTVDFVGIYTGKKMDKFERCGLTKLPSEKVAPPTIAECPISLECRVSEVISMGSHDVFVADILSVSCRGELIDGDGKLRYDKANLLAYAHGEYYALGERLGRFGFSTDKNKTVAPRGGEAKKESVRGEKKERAEDEKKPFYLGMPKGKSKKSNTDKNKGAPRRREKK